MEKEGNKKWNIKESSKTNIKRLFREQVELEVTDETPDVSVYAIKYNDRFVGQIGIAPAPELDLTMEIVYVTIDPKEEFHTMKLMTEVIEALWFEFKDTHRFVLTPMPESKNFWHKMGANRLNNDFLMLQRGH
jgi:RimJ/RimL family protein N-acetyltransferase